MSRNVSQIVLHYSPFGVNLSAIKEVVSFAQTKRIEVVFIDPVPVWDRHIPKMMYEVSNGIGTELKQSKLDYAVYNESLISGLEFIKESNFRRVEVVDYFCNPECEYSSKEGVPYYFDAGHLTLAGSLVLSDPIHSALRFDY